MISYSIVGRGTFDGGVAGPKMSFSSISKKEGRVSIGSVSFPLTHISIYRLPTGRRAKTYFTTALFIAQRHDTSPTQR